MNSLSTYITEKLHLTKDISLYDESDVNTSVSIITDICHINLDKDNESLINPIEDWVKQHGGIKDFFDDVKIYWSKERTLHWALYANRIYNKGYDKKLIDDEEYIKKTISTKCKIAKGVKHSVDTGYDSEIYYNDKQLIFLRHNDSDKMYKYVAYIFEIKD